MPTLIPGPTVIPVPGNKQIREYVGRVNTKTEALSVAHMVSPPGWSEPGQTPEFAEREPTIKSIVLPSLSLLLRLLPMHAIRLRSI